MSTTKRKASEDAFRVASEMGETGRMTVRPLARETEYEIVDYADSRVRERMAALSAGEAVRVELAPAPDDGYVATRVRPGGPVMPGL
jgi:hypothetical protein